MKNAYFVAASAEMYVTFVQSQRITIIHIESRVLIHSKHLKLH